MFGTKCHYHKTRLIIYLLLALVFTEAAVFMNTERIMQNGTDIVNESKPRAEMTHQLQD